MKKNSIFILSLLSFGFMSFASPSFVDTNPQKKNVVLEEFTGIGCVNCPYGHIAANKTAVKYPKTVLINIHQGSFAQGKTPDLTTSFGNALNAQTGQANMYPSGTLNREVIAPSTVTAVNDYRLFPEYAGVIVKQDAYLNVAAKSSIDWASRLLTVTVEVFYTGDSPVSSNLLNVALLQNKILGPQDGMANNPAQIVNGKYQHNHALRDLLTGQWGDSIKTTSKGSFFTKEYTYTIPANIKKVDCLLENMEVVVFVAQSKQNIINGSKSSMEYFNHPAHYANLTQGGQIVHNSCDSAVNGYITLLNKGLDSIVSAKFMLTAGLDTIEYDWTASSPIKYDETDSIVLKPVLAIPNRTNRFTVKILALNGVSYNDSLPLGSFIFNVAKNLKSGRGDFKLVLNHDRYGSDVSWKMYGPNSTEIASGGTYDDLGTNTTKEIIVTIPVKEAGCYYFEIKDGAGDGINNGRGEGSYDITDAAGTTLVSSNGKYGYGEVYYFTMATGTNIEDINKADLNVNIYPIPAKDELTISSLSPMKDVAIYNMTGQVILSIDTKANVVNIDLKTLKNGIYIAKINTEKGVITKKIIIKK